MGYFCKKICHQELAQITQSGHTDHNLKCDGTEGGLEVRKRLRHLFRAHKIRKDILKVPLLLLHISQYCSQIGIASVHSSIFPEMTFIWQLNKAGSKPEVNIKSSPIFPIVAQKESKVVLN